MLSLASDISGQDLGTEPVSVVYWLIENVSHVPPGRAFVFSEPPVYKLQRKITVSVSALAPRFEGGGAAERGRARPRETVQPLGGERCRGRETTRILLRAMAKGDTASFCSRREVRAVAVRRGAIGIGERYCLQLWALVWFGVGAKIWGGGAAQCSCPRQRKTVQQVRGARGFRQMRALLPSVNAQSFCRWKCCYFEHPVRGARGLWCAMLQSGAALLVSGIAYSFGRLSGSALAAGRRSVVVRGNGRRCIRCEVRAVSGRCER